MRESKECAECGGIYFRPDDMRQAQWEKRKYCGITCAAEALKKLKQARKEASQLSQANVNPLDIGPLLPPDPVAAQTLREPPTHERQPIERELKVVRVGPNPTLLVCEYFELAQRHTCTVRVKRTAKFVRGMRLKMAEPVDELELQRPWVYTGPAPKHRGRW